MPQTVYLGFRSTSVTVVAWAFIVLGALAILHPLASGWRPWIDAAGRVAALGVLAVAIGLLRRHEWARRAVIVLAGVAIAASLGGLWVQQLMVHSLVLAPLQASPLPVAVAGVLDGVVTLVRVMGGLVTLLLCGLLAVFIHRLTSPPVRQEFSA